MDKKPGKVLIDNSRLQKKVASLAKKISKDYQGKDILLVGILKGAAIFLADLVRHMDMPIELDFMAISSYGSSTKTSGVVRILKDLDEDIKGKNILIIEDIVDTGLTLSYLIKNLRSRQPKSLEICSLLLKKSKQKKDLKIKYVGFKIPDVFVVGYGLDYNQQYRCFSQIHELN
ncbi:MAG: hypoxanthine phosphoribosyltransferase [Actinobacteria bacterium]|nr:MAG: hypoxanthine phosphoribosyltransferase [Actinomycetota bacterium]